MAFNRRVLKINGAERSFICDDEKDTLADAIRNLGLTGTKVGCGKGQCGACNVILDGKLVRSCTRKMKLVKDYSSVTTIEGLGTAENLHPLQLAWMVYGGVQCGFCTPGFIVSRELLSRVSLSFSEILVEHYKNDGKTFGSRMLTQSRKDIAAMLDESAEQVSIRRTFQQLQRQQNNRQSHEKERSQERWRSR